MKKFLFALVVMTLFLATNVVKAHSITGVVEKIKPSVVGVGVFDPLGAPRANLQGTGFVIGDGTIVATNYHVVAAELAEGSQQRRVIFVGSGNSPETMTAKIIDTDPLHDLAILRIDKPLPALQLADGTFIDDGTEVAFTGFPIGAVLGLYPATHKGIISAKTPVITPSRNATELSAKLLRRLRDPYFVYQMDATAYPGNSGSAVYELDDGKVVAVINKVFVKETKEAALSNPSGITYSIPVKYLRELLSKAGIEGF